MLHRQNRCAHTMQQEVLQENIYSRLQAFRQRPALCLLKCRLLDQAALTGVLVWAAHLPSRLHMQGIQQRRLVVCAQLWLPLLPPLASLVLLLLLLFKACCCCSSLHKLIRELPEACGTLCWTQEAVTAAARLDGLGVTSCCCCFCFCCGCCCCVQGTKLGFSRSSSRHLRTALACSNRQDRKVQVSGCVCCVLVAGCLSPCAHMQPMEWKSPETHASVDQSRLHVSVAM